MAIYKKNREYSKKYGTVLYSLDIEALQALSDRIDARRAAKKK